MTSKESTATGYGIQTTLLVVFVVLKLTGNIDWSWWLVLLPLWANVVAIVALTICYFVASVVDKR